MSTRTWLITGVSSGFGRELTTQLLERGDRVVGTVRRPDAVAELVERYPETFRAEQLDVTDTAALHKVVERSFADLGRIDVIVSNAGYGLFGAAEELSDEQVERIVEPGGARTEFRYGSAQVAQSMPEYDQTPAHSFQNMLDPANGLAPGDPARMAAAMIASVDEQPAPLRMVLGSQALDITLATLRQRLADFETQTELAASTDFPPRSD